MKTRVYTLLAALLLTVASAQSQTATTITVEDIDPITVGQDARVWVTLDPNITTVATVTVSNSDQSYNQSFHVAIVDGYGTCIVPNMAEGTYSCTASFAGNAQYAASTSEPKTLTVSKIVTSMSLTLNDEAIYVGDYTWFNLVLNQSINASAIVSINGVNRTIGIVSRTGGGGQRPSTYYDPDILSIEDGEGNLYNFPAGTYTLQATYAGDDKYVGCTSNEVTLTVNKIATSISLSDISPIQAGDDAVITVTMTPTDENVAPINAIATVTVGNTDYKVAIVNGSGSCVVPNLAAGTYDVAASYATDDKYIGSTSTTRQLVVNESGAGAATPLSKNAVATVTMTPASMNTIVELTVGGNTYHVPVINGTGTYILPQMEKGFYDVQATYAGDRVYATSQSAVQSLMSMANVALADNADNSSTLTSLNDYPARVTLNGRTLWKDGDWNTLCLPFDATLTGDLADATLMELDTEGTYNGKQTGLANDGTLYLYFKTATSIEAGKPYIIKWASGSNIENPVFTGVTIDNTDGSVTSSDGYVTFKGTYDRLEWNTENNSILFLGTKNTLYWPQPSNNQYPFINACRAYFQLNNGLTVENVSAARMNFDGENEVNGVKEVNATLEVNDDSWYTLNGVKLSGKPTKAGLYIHNGKKVIIK